MIGFLSLLGLLWLSPPCDDGRCRCLPPPPAADAARSADAVFTGTVLSVGDTLVDYGWGQGLTPALRATLRVDRAWKGVEAPTVTVLTAPDDGACGFPFRAGEAYLVFAGESEGALRTGLCSRTSPLSRAGADIRELDAMAPHPPR